MNTEIFLHQLSNKQHDFPIDIIAIEDNSSDTTTKKERQELALPVGNSFSKVTNLLFAASLGAVLLKPHIGFSEILSDKNSAVYEYSNLFVESDKTSTDFDYNKISNVVFDKQLNQLIDRIFFDAKNEKFKEGVKSNFSERLEKLIIKYSDRILIVLTDIVNGKNRDIEIIAESLRVVGNNYNSLSKHKCFQFVNLGLQDRSPIIRDSAALACSDIGDATVLPFLQDAAAHEKIKSLKLDILDIIDELEDA